MGSFSILQELILGCVFSLFSILYFAIVEFSLQLYIDFKVCRYLWQQLDRSSCEQVHRALERLNIGFFEIPHFFTQGGSTDQLLNMWGQTPHMR